MRPALETLMLACSGENPAPAPLRRALFLGAMPHPALERWPDLTGWQPHKPLADGWDGAGLRRADHPPDGRWPLVLLLPGKARDEILSAFAIARDRLEPGGRLVVALPNTLGAARFEKEFARATGGVVSVQKHKCRAFQAADDGSWNEEIFGRWRDLADPQPVPGTTMTTTAGVFSHGRIDSGSRLLADHLPGNLHGRIADLGAGWGFLADAALRRNPRIDSIDLFEADLRALDCARANLRGFSDRASFHWHDVRDGLPQPGYDAILTNPPFHDGRAADLDLGRDFIAAAARALKRGGRLFLVANRQLPYEALLDPLGLAWRQTARDDRYKLLFAEKHR